MNKKLKIILICLIAVFVVAAAVLLPLLLIKKSSETRLQTPTNIEVIESQSLIVFKTSKVENAIKYIFEVSIPNLENKTIIESDNEELVLDFSTTSKALSKLFNVGGVYSVQVYAEAKNTIFNSYKSNPTEFNRILKLEKPSLYTTSTGISWAKIENVTEYELLISNTSNSYTKFITPSQDQTISQETISLKSLENELELEKGNYYISIRATNESDFYVNSLFSDAILIEIK